MPWVILGRVLRGEPGAAAAAGAVGAQEQHAVALDLNAPAEAEDAAAADEPHFITSPILMPPGVTILAAGRGAHPNADAPDRFPYIIATSPFCLLAHFAIAPSYGTNFGDNPRHTRLVLVRNFHTAPGQITATAEEVPRRRSHDPRFRNIQGVGLLSWRSNDGVVHTIIAELQVGRVGDLFGAYIVRCRDGLWSRKMMASPLPLPAANREWVPHGAVSLNTTIFWFDLSWGMLSCDDLDVPGTQLVLRYHPLPGGHMLQQATPDIHSWRCITVTDNRLRFVDMVPAAGEAVPTVTMWTRIIRQDGGGWARNYTMSFELIWDDDSYAATGLPREVPVLAAVSPSDDQIVCFALEHNIFAVDVPMHRVVHRAPCNPVNLPGLQLPASGRFLIPWTLPV
ncbi:hypothetical protein BS78_08G134500 [Paspalum vaginatum]|nr:hypothetical protein BS78_08G134500 [Paspalum vaginatum]